MPIEEPPAAAPPPGRPTEAPTRALQLADTALHTDTPASLAAVRSTLQVTADRLRDVIDRTVALVDDIDTVRQLVDYIDPEQTSVQVQGITEAAALASAAALEVRTQSHRAREAALALLLG